MLLWKDTLLVPLSTNECLESVKPKQMCCNSSFKLIHKEHCTGSVFLLTSLLMYNVTTVPSTFSFHFSLVCPFYRSFISPQVALRALGLLITSFDRYSIGHI